MFGPPFFERPAVSGKGNGYNEEKIYTGKYFL